MKQFDYSGLLERLTNAILKEKNLDKREKLEEHYSTLSEQISILIQKNLDNDEIVYKKIISQLEKADKKIQEYSKDNKKISETIDILSKTISILNDFV
ncbi:MAG: hypothetical protein SFU98_15280 [Leptospiraceae bacterium]|nr:hypothetical protein [Leptospiraceae bacterium]